MREKTKLLQTKGSISSHHEHFVCTWTFINFISQRHSKKKHSIRKHLRKMPINFRIYFFLKIKTLNFLSTILQLFLFLFPLYEYFSNKYTKHYAKYHYLQQTNSDLDFVLLR